MSSLALACNLGSLLCGGGCRGLPELFNHSAWFWMLAMVKVSRTTDLPAHTRSFIRHFAVRNHYRDLLWSADRFHGGWLWQPNAARTIPLPPSSFCFTPANGFPPPAPNHRPPHSTAATLNTSMPRAGRRTG